MRTIEAGVVVRPHGSCVGWQYGVRDTLLLDEDMSCEEACLRAGLLRTWRVLGLL